MQTRITRRQEPVGIQGSSTPGKADSRARGPGASPCFHLATAELRQPAREFRFYAYDWLCSDTAQALNRTDLPLTLVAGDRSLSSRCSGTERNGPANGGGEPAE